MDLRESLRERAGKAAQQWAPGAQVTNVVPLTGGASSLTFVADADSAPRSRIRAWYSRWRRPACPRCATATCSVRAG